MFRILFILFPGVFFLTTCISPIDFETEAMRSSLVISGQLTTGNGEDLVEVTRTFPFDRAQGKPVNGATIAVVDDNGKRGEYLLIFEGAYRLDKANFRVETDRVYFLEVELEGGKLYRSEPQSVPMPVRADSVHLEFITEENINSSGGVTEQQVIQVQINTPLPPQSFVRWEVDEWYDFTEFQCNPIVSPKTCYIQVEEFGQLLELAGNASGDTRYLAAQPITNKPLLFSNTMEFESRHYFNVYQYSINRAPFEFWSTAKSVTQQEGTIFDAPPAVIPGNLFSPDNPTEQVRGVFEVATIDTVRTSIINADVRQKITITPFCTMPTQECCNCQRFPKSSRVKPEWF